MENSFTEFLLIFSKQFSLLFAFELISNLDGQQKVEMTFFPCSEIFEFHLCISSDNANIFFDFLGDVDE